MKEQTVIKRYKSIRNTSLSLVKSLELEDYSAQPVVDVSPPKWHLGHTTWFFENFILANADSSYQLFDKRFNYIFNSYYVSQGDRLSRDKRGSLNRPKLESILAYREHVDRAMEVFLNQNDLSEELLNLLEIGLNHEQQHQELLVTDIKYIFSQNPLMPSFQDDEKVQSKSETKEIEYLKIEEGVYEIGHESVEFCFDNEKGRHKVYLQEFEFQNRLVNNQEYLEFIKDRGYEKHELWLSEGWDWVQENQIIAPEYWVSSGKEWKVFTVFGLRDLNLSDTLTHISFYEAEAFARWKGMRLLTEQEWEVACIKFGANSELNHFQESNYFHLGTAKDNQLLGSNWEWTNSAYLPYPKYEQAAGALGEYNGKFMVNQMVLRGGSCATPKSHFRPSYRNFFHPQLRWQFTGIRLAKK